ncbi:MAG: MBOAT family protein, partial [Ruminiclostridium sp.]|nr:MBOAT family protein [Ruminiclostridium sp.]
MVFSSLIFLYCFLPLNLFLYVCVKNNHYRSVILVTFSLAFYAWGEPRWVVLLVFSALLDYVNSLIIENNRGTWKATLALVLSIVINLSLLFFFKYSGFFAQNLNLLLGTNIPASNFSLPIGISFYTFQTLSYTIDVYRNETKAQPSFLKLMLFVSLFHQLVAGPIVRYSDIAAEIDNRSVSFSDISYGINRFVIGLAKKVLLTNTAGELAGSFLDGNMDKLTTGGAWFGIILFSLQIYFDFAGYS